MASDSCGRVDGFSITAEEVPDINHLHNPKNYPVDADKYIAHGERRRVVLENSVVAGVVIGRSVPGVVESRDELQEEREKSKNPVGGDVTSCALDIAGKWVSYMRRSARQFA